MHTIPVHCKCMSASIWLWDKEQPGYKYRNLGRKGGEAHPENSWYFINKRKVK